MWKSIQDTDYLINRLSDLDRLDHMYALSLICLNAVYPEGYNADKRWSALLILNPDGKSLINGLQDIIKKYGEADFYLALFGKFFHHDLIFDWQSTDLKAIEHLIEHELMTEKIKLPYRFGRQLYDRFNDIHHTNRTGHLLPPDVNKLLEGSPHGVYQVGNILTGPLGVLHSEEPRLVPPSLSLPLWHCSDTGCSAPHRVTLEPPIVPVTAAYREISQQLRDLVGPESEWRKALIWLHRRGRWEKGRAYYDLPEIIADCILGKERFTLLVELLKGADRDHIRQVISSPPRKKSDGEGTPEQVTERLSPEVQLQLLLLFSDAKLIELIDDVVAQKKIKIPLGEIRTPKYLPSGRTNDSASILSALGIRSSEEDPILNLISYIWHSYEKAGLINELEWRVRGDSARPIQESLFQYLREKGPEQAIKDLVLSSHAVTKNICEDVQLSLKNVTLNDNTAVDRLLWKMGFNPEQYDDSMQRLYTRLKEFNETVLSLSPIESEDDREKVRSVGVNLFVSLEDFLEKFISYNLWVLASDHFLGNRFEYDLLDARRIVSQVIGDNIESDGIVFSWSVTGENALGTLLRYLDSSTKWISKLSSCDRDGLLRPSTDLPHFADISRSPFPFRHTQLWADADISELNRYSDGYCNISKLINQANIAMIRNGIDHYRDEQSFPDSDKILASIVRLQQAIETADINRYVPKVYWLCNRQGNRHGIVRYDFRDYANRPLTIYGPPISSGLPRKYYQLPVIIAPGNILGHPNSHIMFRFKETSEFSKYWEGYPRRRKISVSEVD